MRSEQISKLPVGTKLYVQEKNNDYLLVRTEYGTGYIFYLYASTLDCPDAKTPKSTSSINASTSKPSSYQSTTRRYSSSRRYIRGPRGGCYYINSNGNKTYVDRSLCN
jgi:hypothetical protein